MKPWLRVGATMFGIAWGANQFVSLLIAYRERAGLSVGTSQALFGVYALGLIPTLLLGGPVSDRRGRGVLLRPAWAISVAATGVLMLGAHSVGCLYVGRFLAGIASGAVFAAGTAWVKELSSPAHEPGAGEQAGARRAAVVLSLGFGLGPVTAGVIAQWAPHPLVLPYVAHLVVMALVLPLLLTAPETVVPSPATAHVGATRPPLLPASALTARFRGVVVPLAPWTFLSVSTAFAVLPGLVTRRTGGDAIAFSALMVAVALGTGIAVQPLARRLDRRDDVRGATVGLAASAAGMLLAAWVATSVSPWVALAAAVPLGAGYGFCLVSGLLETQRLAAAGKLAALTAVFYALTYVGFAGPLVLAELNSAAPYEVLFVVAAGLALACLACVVVSARSRPAPDGGSATAGWPRGAAR